MTEWTDGYRAAIADLEKLAETRLAAAFPTRFRKVIAELLSDLRSDATIIDHEELNRDQRASLKAEATARPIKQGRLPLAGAAT